jgi:hypothetical protein
MREWLLVFINCFSYLLCSQWWCIYLLLYTWSLNSSLFRHLRQEDFCISNIISIICGYILCMIAGILGSIAGTCDSLILVYSHLSSHSWNKRFNSSFSLMSSTIPYLLLWYCKESLTPLMCLSPVLLKGACQKAFECFYILFYLITTLL